MKRKSGRKEINAYIYNLAAINCLTSLLFICLNSPCSPVSQSAVFLYIHLEMPQIIDLILVGLLEVLLKADSFLFSPSLKTVYNDTPDIKWKAQNLNPLLCPFKLRSHRSLTGTSKHWIKQSCQQLGTIINSFCVVSSWVLGLEFYLFKANVNIQCFPQAVPSFPEILDPKGTLDRTQRLICCF